MKRAAISLITCLLLGILMSGCGYPKTIDLGTRSANGANVSELTIQKTGGTYKLTGKTDAPKDGEVRFQLKVSIEKGEQKIPVVVSIPAGKGKSFSVDVKPKSRIKGSELTSMVYEPYEFTAKDYPMEPGTQLNFYAEKQTNGTEVAQPVPVAFSLEGPWDFSQGPTDGEVVYNYIAPKDSPQATDFPEANTSRKTDIPTQATTYFYKRDAQTLQMNGLAIKTLLSEVSLILKFNTPRLLYKYPFKVGDQWQSSCPLTESGLISGNGNFQSGVKVISRNAITVPQGSYKTCYLIQEKYNWTLSDGTNQAKINYSWLVPGVGPVAYVESVNGDQSEQLGQAASFWRLKFKGLKKAGM
jgi:hypothetical protein